MKPTYYSAAWTDSGFLLGCGHEHETIGDAATCIKCAGGSVVGIENGVMRCLSRGEESEFQSAIGDPSKYPAPHIPAPASEKPGCNPGYAVMTRIRVVDHWSWTTGMCFETYGEAVAHAREGDKVVRFESEEWAALKQQEWAEQPQTDPVPPIDANGAPESLPSRAEGEPLVEFVFRLLNAFDPAGLLPLEGQTDDRSTSESDKQTSIIEPIDMARLILGRLSESEIHRLKRRRETVILALLKTLRNPPQTVFESKSRWQ
jgi:hypothetical protein